MAIDTITARIEDLISDFYSTDIVADLDAAYTSAVAHIVDTVPAALLLKEQVAGDIETFTASEEVDVKGKKVLQITRIDDSGTERWCSPANPTDYSIALETDSIFQATEWNPIYTILAGGAVSAAPTALSAGQATLGKVYCFDYPLVIPATTTIPGLPNELIQAVVLKSAINLLQTYIGNAVQEEEDTEIMQLVQGQIGQYENALNSELTRYTGGSAE